MEQGQTIIQSVKRAFALIELLSREQEMGISELSRLSGLHKATVFRMLATLEELGYVRKNANTERYSLSLKFLTISTTGLSNYSINKQLAPVLRELSEEFGETVHLVERSGDSVIYIDKYESERNSIRMVSHIGMEQSMTTTAVGKALLAKEPEEKVHELWMRTEHPAKTEFTITEEARLLNELKQIRLLGYAVDNEENELGVRCVAAAVPDVFGEYRYAISLSAPVSRMDEQQVQKIAAKMAELLQR